jgi:hypothetical protein
VPTARGSTEHEANRAGDSEAESCAAEDVEREVRSHVHSRSAPDDELSAKIA